MTRPYEAVRREAFNARMAARKLSAGCMDCGYAEAACALDYDHRPGEVKSFAIGRAANRSPQSVEREIAKCDVVCANCHRIRTASRRSW